MTDENKFSDYLFLPMPSQMNNTGKTQPELMDENPRTKLRMWLMENLLLVLILIGVLLGTSVGFGLRNADLSENCILLVAYPGELFMRLLKLIILPLIISSLIAGSASLNATLNGKIALRTFVYFLFTSALNAALGVALVVLIHPGSMELKTVLGDGNDERKALPMFHSLLDLGRNIVPDNIFEATFQQTYTAYVPVSRNNNSENETEFNYVHKIQHRPGINTLGLVSFCLIFGTLLGTMGTKSKAVVEFFSVIFDVVMQMVTGIMWLTPVGVFSIIAGKILSVSDVLFVMSQLAWFIITVIIGVCIYQLVIMQLIYLAIVRKNPFKFYAQLGQGTLTAFATASTAASLPITLRIMDDKIKMDPRVSRFVLPIGCNINMDGTALFVAVATGFIAQMNGIELEFGEMITVCLASTAASFSSASVPSTALVLLLVVLTTINVPTKDVSLLFAIDWLVDRFRTTNNMLGDCYTSAVVEHLSKKELQAFQVPSIEESYTMTRESDSDMQKVTVNIPFIDKEEDV